MEYIRTYELFNTYEKKIDPIISFIHVKDLESSGWNVIRAGSYSDGDINEVTTNHYITCNYQDVIKYTKEISPSARGELEITSIINKYLDNHKLRVYKINRGCAWLDAGTPKALQESSQYIKVIEERQGIKIGCIEEASFNKKFINKTQLKQLAAKMPDSDYKEYLEKIL